MSQKRAQQEESPERLEKRLAMNKEIMKTLTSTLAENPSAHLDLGYLQVQMEREYLPHPKVALLRKRQKPVKPKAHNFVSSVLKSTEKPVILGPLSDAVKALLISEGGCDRPVEGSGDDSSSSGSSFDLDRGIRGVIKRAEIIASLPGRGGVLRCRDRDEDGDGDNQTKEQIAIKVLPAETGGPSEMEYSALTYLAEHAPDLPVPKPHGLIRMGYSHLVLMSYIPSVSLRSVWDTLSHDNKLSIQRQLDRFFMRLREIKQQPGGGRLGGVGGHGVNDDHAWVEHRDCETVMTTAEEFREFQFSIEATCGREYAQFLRSLLPRCDPAEPAVFTHGDLFLGNVMVDLDDDHQEEKSHQAAEEKKKHYKVTGVIDWETSGFYPTWYESSKILYTFREDGRSDLQDWWRYVPSCIAPATYPAEWAVARLWDKANGINA